MIDIKINLNNVSSNVDLNSLSSDIGEVIRQLTGKYASVKVNTHDNYSTSPIGVYLTKDYLKFRDKI